jgi:hypothetical protein
MNILLESLYDGAHCYSNNIKDLFGIVFNSGQMAFTKARQTYEQETLRRFVDVVEKTRGYPKCPWSCTKTLVNFIDELSALLPMPVGWAGFGTSFVEVKCHVSTVFVLCLYFVCTLFVPWLHLFVPCLYHVCTTFILHLYHICTTFILCSHHRLPTYSYRRLLH